ncbi:CocE/NonD family hydrolase [Paraburkholderia sp. BL21I4N1]|uniref:CocE/NonD family hydrolase n=1 Tax=Paraburkholderia sp. BL21I4N1 TaxID=1938801 RepID=UPI000CFB25AD|nr:CocE/NonD family hydrolase [Paraburkholderia sp. BL21I4N1]PQV43981.1 hypothetical protein B0G83_13036 [Paraburkholderia sp. BL21I4N1]
MSSVIKKFRKARPPAMGKHPGFGPRTEVIGNVLIERDVAVEISGSRKLYADVFRPKHSQAVPAIVCYAPFGKHPHLEIGERWAGCDIPFDKISKQTPFEVFDPIRWAEEGFAVCVVDALGNWYSEGKATFFSPEEARAGYDVVEWFGRQPWCSGRIGWGGVSYYGMTAWAVAALQPPHLAAILPWDAASDVYRECFFSGGIPSAPLIHNWMLVTGFGTDEVEDMEAALHDHPLFDEYWQERVADWGKIQVPTYAVTEWSNNLHLRGTLEAWKRIGSKDKFLDINGGKEWAEFYSEWAFERQRAFFGQYLKGENNGVAGWTPVRIALRRNDQTWTFRDEATWPLPDVRYVPLYLDASDGSLREAPQSETSVTKYNATALNAASIFDFCFDRATEITGNVKLRIWLAADLANDADVFVAIEKVGLNGETIPFVYSQMYNDGPGAFGWLRASHRELDEGASTPCQPVHRHTRRLWLTHLEPVAMEIEIWPTNIVFESGETLRLIIKGSEVHIVPGAEFAIRHWPLHNDGHHLIHTGGVYDSHLLIPVIPTRQRESGNNQ